MRNKALLNMFCEKTHFFGDALCTSPLGQEENIQLLLLSK